MKTHSSNIGGSINRIRKRGRTKRKRRCDLPSPTPGSPMKWLFFRFHAGPQIYPSTEWSRSNESSSIKSTHIQFAGKFKMSALVTKPVTKVGSQMIQFYRVGKFWIESIIEAPNSTAMRNHILKFHINS